MLLIILSVDAKPAKNYASYDDVTTKNILTKFNENVLNNISKVCTYEYCDYLDVTRGEDGIFNYVSKYLKTLNDEDIKNTLKVKGVKITKIIFKE